MLDAENIAYFVLCVFQCILVWLCISFVLKIETSGSGRRVVEEMCQLFCLDEVNGISLHQVASNFVLSDIEDTTESICLWIRQRKR